MPTAGTVALPSLSVIKLVGFLEYILEHGDDDEIDWNLIQLRASQLKLLLDRSINPLFEKWKRQVTELAPEDAMLPSAVVPAVTSFPVEAAAIPSSSGISIETPAALADCAVPVEEASSSDSPVVLPISSLHSSIPDVAVHSVNTEESRLASPAFPLQSDLPYMHPGGDPGAGLSVTPIVPSVFEPPVNTDPKLERSSAIVGVMQSPLDAIRSTPSMPENLIPDPYQLSVDPIHVAPTARFELSSLDPRPARPQLPFNRSVDLTSRIAPIRSHEMTSFDNRSFHTEFPNQVLAPALELRSTPSAAEKDDLAAGSWKFADFVGQLKRRIPAWKLDVILPLIVAAANESRTRQVFSIGDTAYVAQPGPVVYEGLVLGVFMEEMQYCVRIDEDMVVIVNADLCYVASRWVEFLQNVFDINYDDSDQEAEFQSELESDREDGECSNIWPQSNCRSGRESDRGSSQPFRTNAHRLEGQPVHIESKDHLPSARFSVKVLSRDEGISSRHSVRPLEKHSEREQPTVARPVIRPSDGMPERKRLALPRSLPPVPTNTTPAPLAQPPRLIISLPQLQIEQIERRKRKFNIGSESDSKLAKIESSSMAHSDSTEQLPHQISTSSVAAQSRTHTNRKAERAHVSVSAQLSNKHDTPTRHEAPVDQEFAQLLAKGVIYG